MLFLPVPLYFWMSLQERKEILKGFIFLFLQLQNDYLSDDVTSLINHGFLILNMQFTFFQPEHHISLLR